MNFRTCSKCKESKEEITENFRERRKDSLRFRSECKPCEGSSLKEYRKNNRKRLIEYRKNYDKTENGKYRAKKGRIKSVFKITLEEYENYFVEANSKCKICDNENKLVLDHCHTTNKIRGVLCTQCNSGLGMFKDNIQTMQKAIKYLEENN